MQYLIINVKRIDEFTFNYGTQIHLYQLYKDGWRPIPHRYMIINKMACVVASMRKHGASGCPKSQYMPFIKINAQNNYVSVVFAI